MAEPIGNDATGYDVLTAAMKSLLNQFPGLYPDISIHAPAKGATAFINIFSLTVRLFLFHLNNKI